MITVSIAINGTPIFTRSAIRIEGETTGECVYRVDDANTIRHMYSEGAVALAHKLLDCVIEPKHDA